MPTVIQESPNLGNLLGQGITALANHKVDKMHAAERVKNLRSVFPGMSHDQATFIDRQEPKLQQQYLQQLQPQVQQQEATPQPQQIQPQQQVNQIPAAYQDPNNLKSALEYLKSPQAQQELTPDEIRLGNQKIEKLLQDSQMQQQGQQLQQPQAAPQVVQQQTQPQQVLPQQNDQSNIAKPFLAQAKANQQMTPAQTGALEHKKDVLNEQVAGKYYNSVLAQEKAAKKMDTDLSRMEKLIKKGDLPNPAFYKIVKNLEEITPAVGVGAGGAIGAAAGLAGGPAAIATGATGALVGGALGAAIQPLAAVLRYVETKIYPDTEEFEKLTANFIAGAKSIFPGRITDQDLRLFMETIPSLAQTDKGKIAVIDNMKILNEAEKVKAQKMRDIIKMNGGKRPMNLQEQVEAASSDQLDKLAAKFINR